MALYDTLKLSINLYHNETMHIFTDSLNSLYLLITQIIHPSLHTNHPDKTILSEMVQMLQQRTHTLTIHKVRAHSNIHGNDKVDELAKAGHDSEHQWHLSPHEYAHSTPYFLHKDSWLGNMDRTPYKGPIRHLQKQLTKQRNIFLLEQLEDKFPYISKWTNDPNIDNTLSNTFWTNPQIIEAQIKQILKFRTGQYMGNTRKHLFWPTKYPNPNCQIYTSQEKDTWVHVLLKCTNPIIHGLIVQKHNKAVWEIRKLLLSNPITRHYTLMNAGRFMNSSPENTIPHWLLPCSSTQTRCYCNDRLKPDILCTQGIPYNGTPPLHPDPNITIQFIEFTYTNDRFSTERIQQKINKYTPLINELRQLGWTTPPILILTAGARGTTHIPTFQALHDQLRLPTDEIKSTLTHLNTISIQHLASIILYKRKIEHNQPLPHTQDPP